MLKVCLLNVTLENQNGFSSALITYLHKMISIFFNCIDKALDTHSNYDNALLAGCFNAEDDEHCLNTFLYQQDLYNLVKVGTCFKNSSKPISIKLFLTTKKARFQNTVAICSSLSDFHKFVLMTLKHNLTKKPFEILYWDYKKFNSESFNKDLQNISKHRKTHVTIWRYILRVLYIDAPNVQMNV